MFGFVLLAALAAMIISAILVIVFAVKKQPKRVRVSGVVAVASLAILVVSACLPSDDSPTVPDTDTPVQTEVKKEDYDTGITYDQLARTPDDYEDKPVTLSGEVLQVLEDNGTVNIRLAVDNDYDKVAYGVYDSSLVSSRVLEGDKITVYGTSGGLYSYETVLGNNTTVPLVYIAEIDQVEEKQAKPTSEGDVGDCHVKILDCKYGALDYEGKKTIAVTFEFTNNSNEAQAFDGAVYPVAYQDGVQLSDTIPEADSADYDRTTAMVKTGKKVTCEYYWQTTSDTADVDIEVSSYLDSSTKLQKTFSIK